MSSAVRARSTSPPPLSASRSAASASSRDLRRAEPMNTMVSSTLSRSKRLFGSKYSDRMRTGRASRLLRNASLL
jgi:hypothetical protein